MKDGNVRPPGAAAILTALAAAIMLCAAAIPPPSARPASSQAGHGRNLGVFDGHSDLGEVEIPGRVTFDAEKQEYLLAGSGTNMWLGTDEGHFLWKRLKGDFILSARVEFIGKGVAPHRKIGWMARSTLAQDSAHVSAVVHGDGLTSVQYRKTSGRDTAEDEIGVTGPNQIQLERRGKSYIMSVAHFGETYIREQVDNIALGDEVYAGLFICSHSASVLEQARFTNVRIVTPAKDGFVPYRDYIGSRLEIMDITTKDRKVVYESPKELQAPNWTKDGRALIYNSEGLLYRFDLAAGAPARIETGLAKSLNNDHVLSFNGKRLGISNMIPDEGGTSIIYTLPVEGGKPVRATPKGPSYLHGWSPDGRTLVFTGGRNGNFDVYKIPVRGGKEIRLTKSKALDDGPEYSPDGRYILFNSSRKDGMRIWRMRADGKGQRQVTADTLQDWFPHVSPDGRWIVFLSFEKDVAPEDHPFYKQVYIRIMPIDGGEARILAYVYGGQGTINVPSWSPDSKRIAFVSYTGSIR
ncbi:MAG: biopolymer transporter TolR [Candidatus Aminicenantales bacterium]